MSESGEARFVWGDTVRVANTAPKEARPGQSATIMSLRSQPSGDDTLYQLEFIDGTTVDVEQKHLIPDDGLATLV